MRNLKSVIFTLLLYIMNVGIVSAESTWSIIEDQINNNIPIIKKLSSCTSVNGKYYSVYGIVNGKCHFKTEILNCYVPIDVTKKYSDALLNGYSKMLSNHDVFIFDNNAEYVDMVHENYCTYR